ncbi:hypothetical protein QVN85_04880 [Oscillibacter valericigenes]|nr:hypothetical protein [Oscillibacter valericigenes]
MAYLTVSVVGAQNDARFGKCQFPIKSYIEKKGEGFEQESVLKKLFRMDTSNAFGASYRGVTAMDNFKPVDEGGSYPNTGMGEGYPKNFMHMTWKNQFVATMEAVEDNKIGDIKRAAGQFMTSYNRTREEFARALYVGGLSGTSVQYENQTFDCAAADGLALFSKVHPNKVNKKTQTNLYSDSFSITTLGKAETVMQNLTGDNGELLSVTPDTIWIPNDATIKNTVFAAIGADKDPATANNAFNYQYGRWNVIVDPYLTRMLTKLKVNEKPWFLLDSKFLEEQDGAVFIDRKKLTVKSFIDNNNDNNVWSGNARFTGGFVDWRFVLAGGVSGGSSL